MSIERLTQILADCESGRRLLAAVQDFYGPALRVYLQDRPDALSTFAIDSGGENLQFREASITLHTQGNRVKEASVHELLHLNLPMRGFNLVHALNISPTNQSELARIDETVRKTVNVVQHTIFVNDFVKMGLPLDRFVAGPLAPPQYGAEVRRYSGAPLIPDRAWIAWTWWSLEFLRSYSAIKHGDESGKAFARSAAKWGDRLLPGFKHKAARIADWVDRDLHHQPSRYKDSLNSLFELMALPATAKFCSLKAAPGKAPLVVPID